MKKLLLIVLTVLLVVACKKQKPSPEGPTDVRIKNLTTLALHDVTVDIDTIVNYGVINAKTTTAYVRFPKAYPMVKMTAKIDIDGSPVTFTSENIDYNYMHYIGRMKITYEVFIPNMDTKLLVINVVPEEAIFLDQE